MSQTPVIFVLLNIGLRALLTLCTIYCILRFGPRLNYLERLGAGVVGGASLMTIPLIIDVFKQGTPFDGWATSLITAGVITAFCGLMKRAHAHELRNRDAVEQAKAHLSERGKL